MRICSLLPSATEIVASLGLADSLVAVSEECDWPSEINGLPVVTASRVDTARLSSLEIDQAVREAVGDGRPLYAFDGELLEALEPGALPGLIPLTSNHVASRVASPGSLSRFQEMATFARGIGI